jgi:hypothetical protein
LTSIHVNSTLEPNGLSRDDGKRPDGMTLVPWNKGQPLVWDVTVVDTLADSYVLKTSEVSGFAAEMACKRKHNKYRSIISSNYIFKGLAFETLGPWCKETIDFKLRIKCGSKIVTSCLQIFSWAKYDKISVVAISANSLKKLTN